MIQGCFVSGTDTGVGKTQIALGLLERLAQAGYRTAAMKPVACGGTETNEGIRNEDALLLQSHATIAAPYSEVSPYTFARGVAPHMAAEAAGERITLARIRAAFDTLSPRAAWTVVEGVGGWKVPLNEREDTADLAYTLGLPIVLVVGMRLGCLNHALLTADSIRRRGARLAGWIANALYPEFRAELDQNVEALRHRLHSPLLGVIPSLPSLDDAKLAASYLTLEPLLS